MRVSGFIVVLGVLVIGCKSPSAVEPVPTIRATDTQPAESRAPATVLVAVLPTRVPPTETPPTATAPAATAVVAAGDGHVGLSSANIYGFNDVFRDSRGRLISYRDVLTSEPGTCPFFDLGGEPIVVRSGF